MTYNKIFFLVLFYLLSVVSLIGQVGSALAICWPEEQDKMDRTEDIIIWERDKVRGCSNLQVTITRAGRNAYTVCSSSPIPKEYKIVGEKDDYYKCVRNGGLAYEIERIEDDSDNSGSGGGGPFPTVPTIPPTNPCATEWPLNGKDDDCDGMIDEVDFDNDNYYVYAGCESGNCPEMDCDDGNAAIHPNGTDVPYNGIDEDCDGKDLTIDADNDGHNSNVDCNDNNASIYPGAPERERNGKDDNCNGLADEKDDDKDGFYTFLECKREVCPEEDCDDANANIHPNAIEIINNDIDENCNGRDKIVKWEVSYNGTWDLKKLNKRIGLTNNMQHLMTGDFDGDGITDILQANENAWVYYVGGGEEKINLRPNNGITSEDLLIGDFNGDQIDDLLHATGNIWRVSYNGLEAWETLQQNTATKERMHIGDFNGDGIDDVAVISTQKVKYALGGKKPFIFTAGETFKSFGFLIGDLNGDGKDDVFNGNGTEWRVLYSAEGTWETLKNQSTITSDLQIGYFNRDTEEGTPDIQADIFKATGAEWRVWYQGKGVRQVLKAHTDTNVILGDFNGDGRTDVMRIKEAGQ